MGTKQTVELEEFGGQGGGWGWVSRSVPPCPGVAVPVSSKSSGWLFLPVSQCWCLLLAQARVPSCHQGDSLVKAGVSVKWPGLCRR